MVLSPEMFASLHNHSHYSLLDSTLTPAEIVEQAKELGYKAVAITEHGNLHSVIDGYKKAKEIGIKMIIGCEIYETTDMKHKDPSSDRYHLLLLAENEIGYKNLNKIVSEGHLRGFYGKMRVDLQTLAHYSEGIICTSACLASRLMRLLVEGFCPCCSLGNQEHKETCDYESVFEPKWDEAVKEVEKYKQVFGDRFYIELQSHNTNDQRIGNQRILKLAEMTNTKTIITFDAHMKDGSEKTMDIHRKFVQISQNREVGETYADTYQQDIDTLYRILVPQIGKKAVDEAVRNTGDLADRCNLEIELGRDLMPHIDVPKKFASETEYLKYLLNKGWKERRIHKFPKSLQKIYKERLEKELEVLEELGYQGYFLMLKQILTGIKKRQIPYGYSRGSGANCLCLYVLGVTEVDSIRFDLDFSRFANLGRKGSSADYDLDISKRRRGEVLEMTDDMFGSDKVAHLCTFNSLSPKVCIRDLGKVFDEEKIYEIPYKIRDKISKLIPKDQTIEEALDSSSELRKFEKQYPLLFEYTRVLQNKPKSVGTHASAIIIANEPLTEYSALMRNKDGRPMLHLEMGNAENDIGLVKMDYLGLQSLDVVDDTLRLSGLSWKDIDLSTLDLDDQEVFDNIYASGNTLGIFQMESYVAQNLFKEIKPDSINDVFAVNAMNRPAVLSVNMHKEYIHNKHHPKDIKLIHKDIKPIVQKTNGVLIYQEQALSVFALAGFPEDRRDVARRAIGKKKADVMEKLFEDFAKGLEVRKWSQKQIEAMWKLIEAGASYSFNLGHASSYGLLSYVTAWLKHYYPTQFMTALLISEIGNYEETSKYMNECNQMGIEVLPPDINKSERYYALGKNPNEILFGFESIKGVGEKAVDIILNERDNGEYLCFDDFVERCNVDTTTVIALIKAGAFGKQKEFYLNKFSLMNYTPTIFKPVKTVPTKKVLYKHGIIETDEEFKDKEACLNKYNEFKKQNYLDKEAARLQGHLDTFRKKYITDPTMYEFETLSMFLNGNPFDPYKAYFTPFEDYEDGYDNLLLGGTISSIERKKQKNGGTMAYIELITLYGIYEGMIFADNMTRYSDLIEKGRNIVTLVKKSGNQFIVNKIKSLDDWVNHVGKGKKKASK